MSGGGSTGQKRSRAQYGHQAKRQRGARQLEVGMQGILITCNMNQGKCIAEAYSLLNAYAEELYGPEKFSEQEQQQSENENEDDMEAALKKEVDEISSSTQKNIRRFQSVESGANNVIFIKTHSIEPEKFVHHILKDLYTTKKNKSHVILRMLPFSGTCKAFLEDMKKYADIYFQPWFKAPNKGTFRIQYKARNNSHMDQEEVIKELTGIVASLNPKNKVDLGNPKYTVVIEIIKSVCCMTVVEDYILFRKYNLQEVVKDKKKEAVEEPNKTPEGRLPEVEQTVETKQEVSRDADEAGHTEEHSGDVKQGEEKQYKNLAETKQEESNQTV